MRTIAIANQKGGVAKTTSTYNLASVKAIEGNRVLMIDLDPQASLTISCGLEPSFQKNVCDLFKKTCNPLDCILKVELVDNLYIIPSDIDLARTEVELTSMMNSSKKLKSAIRKLDDYFDYCFIDCPPQLGILVVNALASSNDVIIPVKTDYLSFRGLSAIINTINNVTSGDEEDSLNPNLNLLGIIATFFESNVNDHKAILKALEEQTNVIGIVRKSADVPRHLTEGLPVVVSQKDRPTSIEYYRIASNIK